MKTSSGNIASVRMAARRMRQSGRDGGASAAEDLRWPGRYLALSALGHLAWEFAQMPFYTLWATGDAREIVFAAVHCTIGDVLIAAASLLLAQRLLSRAAMRSARFLPLAALTLLFGLAYTVLSEWLNTRIWRSWAYADLMPVLPPLGTGLLPLLQWLAVPLAALIAARG